MLETLHDILSAAAPLAEPLSCVAIDLRGRLWALCDADDAEAASRLETMAGKRGWRIELMPRSEAAERHLAAICSHPERL